MPHNTFTPHILEWYAAHGRDLPWRGTRDPYAIWLSEVILQQTRIRQGGTYWERFMRRWPDVESLAAATEDEVLRMWQGLGYYSRARNLHTAAQQIVALGHFPTTFGELRKLKGIGDYTAAAIASLAFDQPCAVVDGNVYRVLARHFGIDTPINSTEGKHVFADLAQSLLPVRQAADFNQGMMDFGSIQCTPQSPRCLICPLLDTCDAARTGRTDMLPVKLKTTKVQTRHFSYIYLRCRHQTALHQRGAGDIWQGLWEPPHVEGEEPLPDFCKDARVLKRNVRHVLTHRILLTDFYLLETDSHPALPAGFIWVDETDIDRYALPRLVELLLEAVHRS